MRLSVRVALATSFLVGCHPPPASSGKAAVQGSAVEGQEIPLSVGCDEVVHPPSNMRVVDVVRRRAGHGREAVEGDQILLRLTVVREGVTVTERHENHRTLFWAGAGCTLRGVQRGEVRSYRITRDDAPTDDETIEVVHFSGAAPTVRSKKVRVSGSGPVLESGDTVSISRTTRIDGRLTEREVVRKAIAYTEGFGALLLGLRVGDDIAYELDGLDTLNDVPGYDPNEHQHIALELKVIARLKTLEDQRREHEGDVARDKPPSRPSCPAGSIQCPGGIRDSWYCHRVERPSGAGPHPTSTACPRRP